ncbi:hypothetical protein [Nesterenkonia alba]|uniref:hypothetical protein n=1 Tax=Nesterenkonia alba TaxID=515814 RepID=UPI0003B65604|nr:hypothetical protein [Nesterenkonia alba]
MIRELRNASWGQLSLRAAIVVSAVIFGVLAGLVSGRGVLDFWTGGLSLLLGVAAALVPQGPAPLALLSYVLGCWWLANDDVATAWSLLVATLVLTIHVCAALAAVLPLPAVVPSTVWRRYLIRAAGVMAAVILVWTAVRLAAGMTVPGGVVALFAAVVLILLAALAYARWAAGVSGVYRFPEKGTAQRGPGL